MPIKVHTKKSGQKYIKRKDAVARGIKAKSVARIAKNVVINNQEMKRRETGVRKIQYLDGVDPNNTPPTTVYEGLAGRSTLNCVINPLNYGWENAQSAEENEEHMFVGKGIHPRFLKTKLMFSFPSGENAIESPMRIQLVWGFVKKPTMYTPYTTPKSDEATVSNLRDYVRNQVAREFDSGLDTLKFNIKRPNNYIITGRRWIRPDRRHRVGAPQNYVLGADGLPDPRSTGAPPKVKQVISWKMGKKWRLQRSGDLDEDPEDIQYYNNENWIPWFLIYSPDFGNVRQDPANYDSDGEIEEGKEDGGGSTGQPVPAANRIQVEHNSCMWFNDA